MCAWSQVAILPYPSLKAVFAARSDATSIAHLCRGSCPFGKVACSFWNSLCMIGRLRLLFLSRWPCMPYKLASIPGGASSLFPSSFSRKAAWMSDPSVAHTRQSDVIRAFVDQRRTIYLTISCSCVHVAVGNTLEAALHPFKASGTRSHDAYARRGPAIGSTIDNVT